MPALEVVGVSKSFGSVRVLTDVSLAAQHGQFLAILGPSGSGKSTLLQILAGFETPTSGAVRLEDRDVTAVPPYRRNVNIVFQSYALFPHMTVFENVAYGLRRKRVAKEQIRHRVAVGDWKAAQEVPSIRALAAALRVSVITVKRAYLELEREGVIVTRHGKGSFVAGGVDLPTSLQEQELDEHLAAAARIARLLGLSDEELAERLEKIERSMVKK